MLTSKDDLAKIRGVKLLMSKARLDLQGNAVASAASLITWLNDLEVRIKDDQEKIVPSEKKEVINDL